MTPEEEALLLAAGFEIRYPYRWRGGGIQIHDRLTGHAIPLYRALQIAEAKLRDKLAKDAGREDGDEE